MKKQQYPAVVTWREIKDLLASSNFVSIATIADESYKPGSWRTRLVRLAARKAIAAYDRVQAEHIVVVRFPRLMDGKIRSAYNRMMRKPT